MIRSENAVRGDSRTRHRVLLSVVLFTLLASVYMITYSGQVEIGDQIDYFDTTGSFVRFGEWSLDLTYFQNPPRYFAPGRLHPLRDSIIEPGFIFAAAPLYWLAEVTPGLGLVHTAYLINILTTAILGVLIFWWVLALDYREGVALLAALTIGLGTIVFPYSQTYFRETLAVDFLIAAALLLELGRRRGYGLRHGGLVLGAGAFCLFAYVTKEAALLGYPALLVLMLPDPFWRRVHRAAGAALMIALGSSVALAYTDLFSHLQVIPLVRDYYVLPDYAQTALHTYLFSVGGSLWGTSPVVLLGLVGGVILWRRGSMRLMWAAALAALTFAYAYALLRGEHWFGGTIWPQRFLLPAVPFLVLPLLPVFEQLQRRVMLAAFALFGLYSLWWQAAAVSFRWEEYSRAIYDESFGGLVYWLPGFNEVRYLRPVELSALWGQVPLNFAWVRADLPLWGMAFALLAVGCAALLRRQTLPRAVGLLPLVWLALTTAGLFALYPRDPAYMAADSALHEMVTVIRNETTPGDVVLLNDPTYLPFFLNSGKVGRVHLPVLPYHPGERGSFEQPLERISDNADVLLADHTIPTIDFIANQHARLWLLTSGGPEIPWSMRPLERFLGQHYYRVRERRTDADVRLLEYSTADAPDTYGFYGPEVLTAITYRANNGDALTLEGFTLSSGTRYHVGAALPLSLLWRVEQSTPRNYTVAWFVVDAATGVIALQGEDTWPGATFKPTSRLRTGVPVWDHRALWLHIPPGDYRLRLLVYDYDDATGQIRNLSASGGEILDDGSSALLPVTLQVEAAP